MGQYALIRLDAELVRVRPVLFLPYELFVLLVRLSPQFGIALQVIYGVLRVVITPG